MIEKTKTVEATQDQEEVNVDEEFEKLGLVSVSNDGKIIKDENNEDVKIENKDYHNYI